MENVIKLKIYPYKTSLKETRRHFILAEAQVKLLHGHSVWPWALLPTVWMWRSPGSTAPLLSSSISKSCLLCFWGYFLCPTVSWHFLQLLGHLLVAFAILSDFIKSQVDGTSTWKADVLYVYLRYTILKMYGTWHVLYVYLQAKEQRRAPVGSMLCDNRFEPFSLLPRVSDSVQVSEHLTILPANTCNLPFPKPTLTSFLLSRL